MAEGRRTGRASISFEKGICIAASASVVGKKEGEGPLGELFDAVSADDFFGTKTWEDAESTLQKEALGLAIGKAGLSKEQVRYLYAGDLLGQSIATSFGISTYEIPLFGLYGACSTCGEALLAASISIGGGFADTCACVTSSHFASAEKEFRFPLAYGNQRPLSSTWTVTGSGAFVLAGDRKYGCRALIKGGTVGKIVDYGYKDSMNMGACMAPAAADTIYRHMQDFHTKPEDYDHIVTGDLGGVGQNILFELLEKKGLDIRKQHLDCGMLIFDNKEQDTHSGGSGCGCAATVLSAYLLKELYEKNWKRILFLPTGALLSKTSFNEGKSVPGICHGILLESAA